MKESLTLAFVGDVMLGRGVNEVILHKPPESFWGNVLPILQGADGAIANLECAITQNTQQSLRTPKVFHFRADPPTIDVLRVANIQCVSLANNHSLDFEDQGLLDTLHYLDTAGIHRAGAGRNLDEAVAPAIVDIAGFKVGFIALTDNEPHFAASSDRPGTNYLKVDSEPITLAPIQEAVKQLRRSGASLVVLSAHLGPNMVTSPSPQFRKFARAALDSGVDLFYGHSAHVFQGVECYGHGLILYDTGDFLDDYAVDPDLRNDWSFVFLVDVNSEGMRQLRMVPVRLNYAQVNLAEGEEFEAIREEMRSRCAPFNTPVRETPEGLAIQLS